MGQKRNLKEQFKKYIELKQNENRTYQNLWDTAKAVLRERFIALNVYIRKESSEISLSEMQERFLFPILSTLKG